MGSEKGQLEGGGAAHIFFCMHPTVAAYWEKCKGQTPGFENEHKEHDVLQVQNPHPKDAFVCYRERGHLYSLSHDGTGWGRDFITSVSKVISPWRCASSPSSCSFLTPPSSGFPMYKISLACAKKQIRLQHSFLHPPELLCEVWGMDRPKLCMELFGRPYEEVFIHRRPGYNGNDIPQRVDWEVHTLTKYLRLKQLYAMSLEERSLLIYQHCGELAGLQTPWEIREFWDMQRNLGTQLHADIEMYLNGHPAPKDPSPEWFQFMDYFKDHVHEEPYRTESVLILQ